jgi:hypothetical protein
VADPARAERVVSLDYLRGFVVALVASSVALSKIVRRQSSDIGERYARIVWQRNGGGAALDSSAGQRALNGV